MKQRPAINSKHRLLGIIFLVALIIAIPHPEHISSVHAQADTLGMRPLIVDSKFRVEPLLGTFDVQGFLEDRSSGLAGSLVPARGGSLVKASTVINDISLHYGIAPQVILVLMQIRSGIVEARDPSPAQLNAPLGLPDQLASGFYAQIESVAKKLDLESPRYYQAGGTQAQELLPLADGTLVAIPRGKSPTSALLKFFGTGSNDSRALDENAVAFDVLYREYYGTDPLAFPDQLTASLSGARLPFVGTRRYTGGPHGGKSTSPCNQIAIGDGSGIDFARNTSSDVENWEVLSILPGTLLSRDTNVNYGIGNRIRIQHSDTLVSEYWHLDKFSAEIQSKNIGDSIPQGFPLGNAGDSGGQSAIHLHLDLRTPSGSPVQWDGESIDGYTIGIHKVFDNQNLGLNYQGSAVLGRTKRKQITAYCPGPDAYALVGTNFNNATEQNGVDPDTIFADISYNDPNAGRVTSTNILMTGNEGFNGSALKPFWHWVREDPAHWSITDSPGYLRMVTGQNEIRESTNNSPLLLQSLEPFPDKDFVIQTHILLTPIENFQQGGLVIYADDDNYVRLTYGYMDGPAFEFAKELGGSFQAVQIPAPPGSTDFHLLLAKSGFIYSAYYSQDGNDWKWIGSYSIGKLSPLEVGLLAFNGLGATTMEIPADFDYFKVISGADKTAVFNSQPTYDGWVLESGEFTNKGGIIDDTGTVLNVGDDSENRQYRTILSFPTARIPDNAVITRVILKIKGQGLEGSDPMKTHNGLIVDIRKNKFYTLPALQLVDFQAKPGKFKVGVFPDKLISGWYKAVLYRGGFPYINQKGRTQVRLRFQLDDNNDNLADILKLYSGNANLADRPKLIVKYYLP